MPRLLLDHHAGGEIYDRMNSNDAFDIERVHAIEALGPMAEDEEIWTSLMVLLITAMEHIRV